MYVISIMAKLLIVLMATQGFIHSFRMEEELESRRAKIISRALCIAIFLAHLIVFYLAGVFNTPRV